MVGTVSFVLLADSYGTAAITIFMTSKLRSWTTQFAGKEKGRKPLHTSRHERYVVDRAVTDQLHAQIPSCGDIARQVLSQVSHCQLVHVVRSCDVILDIREGETCCSVS